MVEQKSMGFCACGHPILGVQLAYAKSYGLISIPGFDHGSYVTHLQDQTIKQTIKQTVRLCPSLKNIQTESIIRTPLLV